MMNNAYFLINNLKSNVTIVNTSFNNNTQLVENLDNEISILLFFIFNLSSLVLNFILLLFILPKKQSYLYKIFRNSIYAEAFMNYCFFTIYGYFELNTNFIKSMFQFLENVNMINLMLKQVDIQMIGINSVLIFALQTYIYIIQIFIFIEIIMVLKYPFNSTELRNQLYFYFSFALSIIIILLNYKNFNKQFDVKYFSEYENIILDFHYSVMLILILYVLMIIVGILCLFLSLKRLGCKEVFKMSYYNKFLIHEILMSFTFFIMTIPYMILIFFILIKEKSPFNKNTRDIILIIYFCLGIVQFFFRVTETVDYSKILIILKKKVFCFCSKNNISNITLDSQSSDIVCI